MCDSVSLDIFLNLNFFPFSFFDVGGCNFAKVVKEGHHGTTVVV